MLVMAIIGFGGALTVAGYAIAATVAPNFEKILSALRREPQVAYQPLTRSVRAERYLSVRRRAGSAPQPSSHYYEAA